MSDSIDVTVPIREGMVHRPDNPGVRLESNEEMHEGGALSRIGAVAWCHTAPTSMRRITSTYPVAASRACPWSRWSGWRAWWPLKAKRSNAHIFERSDLRPGDRILFKTSNSERC